MKDKGRPVEMNILMPLSLAIFKPSIVDWATL